MPMRTVPFSRICLVIPTFAPTKARHGCFRLFRIQLSRDFPFDPSNPCGFSQETLTAMDDTVTGRNLSGPYHTVKEVMVALDEE